MFRLAALGFSGVAMATPLPGEKDWSGYSFGQYVKDFNKSYVGENGNDRKANFEAMLHQVIEHNRQEDKTWFATINEFSDLTAAEFKAFVKGRLPHTQSWGGMKEEFKSTVDLASLPDSVDWRTKKGVVTKVKNQGQCGGCWAFSSTESLESHLAIATGQPAPVLSVQQILDCTPNPQQCGGHGGCEGATQPLAFNYTSTIGLATEYDYPYEEQTDSCRDSHMHPVAINQGYVELATNDYTALITAVATKGPVSISIAASSFSFQMYGGGVGGCGKGDYDMDHAVQLVGYGTDNGKDYWLVRNSWGKSWGEDGYIRMHRYGEGKEPCGMDEKPGDGDACKGDTKPKKYCGECGILSASSYPTGLKKVAPAPGPAPKPHKGNICRKISTKNACQKCEYENDCGFDPTHALCLSNDPDCDGTDDVIV